MPRWNRGQPWRRWSWHLKARHVNKAMSMDRKEVIGLLWLSQLTEPRWKSEVMLRAFCREIPIFCFLTRIRKRFKNAIIGGRKSSFILKDSVKAYTNDEKEGCPMKNNSNILKLSRLAILPPLLYSLPLLHSVTSNYLLKSQGKTQKILAHNEVLKERSKLSISKRWF